MISSCYLGTSGGISILDLLTETESICQSTIAYTIAHRREGDPSLLVADASFTQSILKRTPKYSCVHTILNTAWVWLNKRF